MSPIARGGGHDSRDHSVADTVKEKRASRACLACRARKSKCDLDTSCGQRGQPPCKRCKDEGKECVLTVSKRGGRRERRVAQVSPDLIDTHSGASIRDNAADSNGMNLDSLTALPDRDRAGQIMQHDVYRNPHIQDPPPTNVTETQYSVRRSTQDDTWNASWGQHTRQSISHGRPPTQSPTNLETHIANQDLLNPSDALELLGRVQSHEDGSAEASPSQNTGGNHRIPSVHQTPPSFPPIANAQLTLNEATQLLRIYREKYHPYFPVAYNIFDDLDIVAWTIKEPHLLCAILTIASKDNTSFARAQAACSTYMEALIGELINKGSTSVGAVEALLILAEWAPQRLQAGETVIGLGEEDRGSWMQVGCAVRLGYLQRLEETGLSHLKDPTSDKVSRQRLAWAACYMSDRQISIRLGKGFWSRGPGPSTVLRAADFPTLRNEKPGSDDLALLFQAHIDLTQLFSNAHDILYSSSSHREQLYRGGEYVRYIDDFSATLRNWKVMWGGLSFTPHVKATLILSYEFLRLYVNAFAFQAAINREITRARETSSAPVLLPGALFANVASSPDARFIYESIDAANSLIGTLNSFIDPVQGLRYMPLKYYLYVIHAAVFLFKARSAGALGHDTSTMVRSSIDVTIERLQQSSVNRNGPGHRYARMLQLLWRQPSETIGYALSHGTQASPRQTEQQIPRQRTSRHPSERRSDIPTDLDPLNGFSWRDLNAVGNYIAQGTGTTDFGFSADSVAPDIGGIESSLASDWNDQAWFSSDIVF